MKTILKCLVVLILMSPIVGALLLGVVVFGENGFSSLISDIQILNVLHIGMVLFCIIIYIAVLPVAIWEVIKNYSSTLRGMAIFYFLISIYIFVRSSFEVVSYKLDLDYFIQNFSTFSDPHAALKFFYFSVIMLVVTSVVGTATHKLFPK